MPSWRQAVYLALSAKMSATQNLDTALAQLQTDYTSVRKPLLARAVRHWSAHAPTWASLGERRLLERSIQLEHPQNGLVQASMLAVALSRSQRAVLMGVLYPLGLLGALGVSLLYVVLF